MTIAREESVSLACGFGAPGEARRFARRVAAASGTTLDTIELLVSELVTNVVLHAHSRVELTLRDLGDRTRVEVSDASTHPPEMRPPHVTGGRGLHIVEALAARWGIEVHIDGKTVWFEI